jgi:hypothetical protein
LVLLPTLPPYRSDTSISLFLGEVWGYNLPPLGGGVKEMIKRLCLFGRVGMGRKTLAKKREGKKI